MGETKKKPQEKRHSSQENPQSSQSSSPKKLLSIKCSFCGEAISYDPTVMSSGKAIMLHKQSNHAPEMEELRQKAIATRHQKSQERQEKRHSSQENPQSSQSSPESTIVAKSMGEGSKMASTPEQANVFVIRPQRYEISSLFILIAKEICEKEWNWPRMDVSRWLDTFLFHAMRQRGYVIASYHKLEEVASGQD